MNQFSNMDTARKLQQIGQLFCIPGPFFSY